MTRQNRALASLIGVVVGGSVPSGVIGPVFGVGAALADKPVGAGLALAAAALAFGLPANALLRQSG